MDIQQTAGAALYRDRGARQGAAPDGGGRDLPPGAAAGGDAGLEPGRDGHPCSSRARRRRPWPSWNRSRPSCCEGRGADSVTLGHWHLIMATALDAMDRPAEAQRHLDEAEPIFARSRICASSPGPRGAGPGAGAPGDASRRPRPASRLSCRPGRPWSCGCGEQRPADALRVRSRLQASWRTRP